MEVRKLLAIAVLVTCGCQKDLQTSDIITDLKLNPATINADGMSKISVSVRLTDKAADNRKNVILAKTLGTWVGAKGDTLIVPAVYVDKQLIAKATLMAPSKPGTVIITAFSQALTSSGDYVLTGTIIASRVEAASIKLEPSTLGVGSNATSEVTITGKISGSTGGNASQGVTVILEDYLSSGLSAGGHFRLQQLTSNNLSQISAVYSAGNLPVGTNINIVGTIVDDLGKRTNISGNTILTINL